MNLHQAEFIAGELAAFAGCAVGITWAWLQYKAPPPDEPDRTETEYSSLNDD